MDEHYHSTFGAITESKHVFIGSGYKTMQADHLKIFELGFGTGLNALLTLHESLNDKKNIKYVGVEKYPLDKDILIKLNYSQLLPETKASCFDLLHECEWEIPCRITDNFILLKLQKDIRDLSIDMVFDLVYYDAFAPGKQPDMWSYDLLSSVSSLIRPGGVLVTYSAMGQLKRDLRKLGFKVENPAGPPGKRQITRAVKRS